MKALERLNKWANRNTNLGFDVLRIVLGGFLFLKGIEFAMDSNRIVELLGAQDPALASLFLAHYIAMAHFAGGVMIALGLLTRLSILIQLPLIIGAVLINFIGMMDIGSLLQASFVLILATFFLAYGSGKHSVDYNLKLHV
jgi:putative oxidoreductase